MKQHVSRKTTSRNLYFVQCCLRASYFGVARTAESDIFIRPLTNYLVEMSNSDYNQMTKFNRAVQIIVVYKLMHQFNVPVIEYDSLLWNLNLSCAEYVGVKCMCRGFICEIISVDTNAIITHFGRWLITKASSGRKNGIQLHQWL